MPIYEYKCSDCGKVSEILEGVGKSGTPKCPACGGLNFVKLPSVASCISSKNMPSAVCKKTVDCSLSRTKDMDCACCPAK